MNTPRYYVVDTDRISAAFDRGAAVGWAAGSIVTGLICIAVVFFLH